MIFAGPSWQRAFGALAVGTGVTLASTPCLAQYAGSGDAPAQDWTPLAAGSRVGLQLDIWPGSYFTSATFGAFAQIGVHKNVAIDVDLPWAVGGGSGEIFAALGNPTIGAHAVGKAIPELALFGGLSVSFPTRTSYASYEDQQF
jgi:hypothetical protein